jgi:hypothetical protein
MVSFTQGPRALPLYRTAYIDKFQGPNDANVVIPPYACRFSFWSADATVTATITVYDVNGNALLVFKTTANGNMTPIPLPGDAFKMGISKTAGPNAQARVVFELGL